MGGVVNAYNGRIYSVPLVESNDEIFIIIELSFEKVLKAKIGREEVKFNLRDFPNLS